MNKHEAQKALQELMANAKGRIEFNLDGMTLLQRCVICRCVERIQLEISDAGDERTFRAMQAFQIAHAHKE